MKVPLLHLMIPSYGRSPYLHDTLQSACKNLTSETLITVLEDPSGEDAIQKTVQNFSPRVEYIKNKSRLGVAGNFNMCLKESKGLYTQIIGHDDLVVRDPTNKIFELRAMEDFDTAGIIFSNEIINEQKLIHRLTDFSKLLIRPRLKEEQYINPTKLLESIMIGYWAYFPAIVWKSSTMQKFTFDSRFESAMDLKMLIDLSIAKFKFIYSKDKIVTYRRHNQSVSSLNAIYGGRLKEEIDCHKTVYLFAKKNRLYRLAFFSKLALFVRLNSGVSRLIRSMQYIRNLKVKEHD
jgi:hypothetical protein